MADVVLDASALLALLQGEAGAERVAELLPDAVISAVNYAEVISKLVDIGVPANDAVQGVGQLAIEIAALDPTTAADAGRLRARTREAGLSLGDRACLALAKARDLPAVTADRAWASVDAGVEIVLIR